VDKRASGLRESASVKGEPLGEAPEARTRHAVAVWLRLARFVNAQHSALSARLRASRLSLAQFDIIAQIGAREGLSQKQLAERLVVTQGNVTQLLQKLEKRRLVLRPPDGRCNRVQLTMEGQRLRNALVPHQERAITGLFATLSDVELDALSRLLRKLLRARPGEQLENGHEAPQEDFDE